ncbi:MAG: N-acetylglucosamine malate deacetylase 1 [Frankiales bacterium]|jgi:LmbE family N-acetylglucosaminyl deacetylase|nr:N-acetylglucosamine malate deacetylase 1 [Frankiales bacterium]
MRVVAVVAHPDDEVLGVGGTLARHAREGAEVTALVVADGASSRYPTEMRDELRLAGQKAAVRLGLAEIVFADLPDQRLDSLPLIEVTGIVDAALDAWQPDVVYTHFAGDVNLDHGVVARATWTACRPYQRRGVRELFAFETPSSTEWGWPGLGDRFSPNAFVDIEETLDAKIAAMACYDSELRAEPHPRGLNALRTRAAYWGSVVGMSAAEPFMVLRTTR